MLSAVTARVENLQEYAADRDLEVEACHNIMAECRTIAGDPRTSTVDAVRGLLARAEKAEAALAERDWPCVWRYKRYSGWASTCGVRPENWNTAWRFCPFCGYPIQVSKSDNDLLSAETGEEAGAHER